MSNELTIVRQENISLIVSKAPEAYNENVQRHDRCLEAGNLLLSRITANGMDDQLDQEVAHYLDKARKTAKLLNENRAPLTKLFDQIRNTFTGLENEIDVTKANSVPFLLQAERNRYAAKKREEELARQREAMRQQQIKQVKEQYRMDSQVNFRRSFLEILGFYVDGLRNLYSSATLEDYDKIMTALRNADVKLPDDLKVMVGRSSLPIGGLVPAEEMEQIRTEVLDSLMPSFTQEYEDTMTAERDRLISLMPSRRQELERAAQASAEEAERIKAEMAAKEAAEAARLAEEQAKREQQLRMEAELKAKQAEVGNLFDQAQAAMPTYQPKTSVKKKLVPLNAEAFPEIITLWWTKEGCTLPVDELYKMFKKQITFCEKLAKDGEFIHSENISYEDEVKAK